MSAASIVRTKSDADVLTDLQGLGTTTAITGYSSQAGQGITWEAAPGAIEKNAVLAYFQQNNHLETI